MSTISPFPQSDCQNCQMSHDFQRLFLNSWHVIIYHWHGILFEVFVVNKDVASHPVFRGRIAIDYFRLDTRPSIRRKQCLPLNHDHDQTSDFECLGPCETGLAGQLAKVSYVGCEDDQAQACKKTLQKVPFCFFSLTAQCSSCSPCFRASPFDQSRPK